MPQKYLFIAISFYFNIVRQNVSCEYGLTEEGIIVCDNMRPMIILDKIPYEYQGFFKNNESVQNLFQIGQKWPRKKPLAIFFTNASWMN